MLGGYFIVVVRRGDTWSVLRHVASREAESEDGDQRQEKIKEQNHGKGRNSS